ncbi:MAG: hypothetical protein K0S32_2076 [Bacteroidetes bacterium]|jgi:hypothetical protein|nr:hypothetical protein [Bacteroidota bacterium]
MLSQQENLCPKCHSAGALRSKLIMLGTALTEEQQFKRVNFEGYTQVDALTADEVRDEFLLPHLPKQYVNGFFCETCHVGFVPDFYLKENNRFKR